MPQKSKADRERIGLCGDCQHMRQIESARGSIFYMCERSASNPLFEKYPRLPVIHCPGHEPKAKPIDPSRQGCCT